MKIDELVDAMETAKNNILKVRAALECPDSWGLLECAALRMSQAVVYKRHLEAARAHLGDCASVPDTVLAWRQIFERLREQVPDEPGKGNHLRPAWEAWTQALGQ